MGVGPGESVSSVTTDVTVPTNLVVGVEAVLVASRDGVFVDDDFDTR